MTVIWLNATVGAGKTVVGQSLARLVPRAVFVDGDDEAGPPGEPGPPRWRRALLVLLRLLVRRPPATLVIAYPLQQTGYQRVKAACAHARRRLIVVTLATPLTLTLRGRGGRHLDAAERARVRTMRSQGYHRRPFAALSLPNANAPPARTAWQIARFARSHHPARPSSTAWQATDTSSATV